MFLNNFPLCQKNDACPIQCQNLSVHVLSKNKIHTVIVSVVKQKIVPVLHTSDFTVLKVTADDLNITAAHNPTTREPLVSCRLIQSPNYHLSATLGSAPRYLSYHANHLGRPSRSERFLKWQERSRHSKRGNTKHNATPSA